MKHKWMAIPVLVSITSQAHGTLILDDGNIHQINSSIFEDVRLENGSDLHLIQGGSILSTASPPAIFVSGDASTITLSGDATATGGIHYHQWGNDEDAVIAHDDAQILGQGEKASGYGRGAVSGARRVETNGNASLIGADNAVNGGDGIDNTNSGGVHVSMNGGQVAGGSGGESGGNGIDGGIEMVFLSMNDGTIQGGEGTNDGGHGITTNFSASINGAISGGSITGGNGVTGGDAINSYGFGVNLDISGGRLQGGDGGLYGGDAINTYTYGYSSYNTTISGGYFDAGSGLLDDGWILNITGRLNHIDITGGLFGSNNAGNGFGIFNRASVDVHGWNLELNNDLLTGYLLDGSWIETSVTLALDEYMPAGILNIVNHDNPNASVPEPGSLMLLAIGLAGVWTTRQRKAVSHRGA